MKETIRVDIPESILENAFAAFLAANQSEYQRAFNRRAKDHDIRSEVDHVRITDIQIDNDQATISYEVDFCLRYECQDLVHSDTHRRKITATRLGRTFFFKPDVPTESRSTSEEF